MAAQPLEPVGPHDSGEDPAAIFDARPGYEEAVQDAVQERAEMFTRYTPPEWEGRV